MPVLLTGGPPDTNYTAKADSSWIVVNPAEDRTQRSWLVEVKPEELAAGTHLGLVEVVSPDGFKYRTFVTLVVGGEPPRAAAVKTSPAVTPAPRLDVPTPPLISSKSAAPSPVPATRQPSVSDEFAAPLTQAPAPVTEPRRVIPSKPAVITKPEVEHSVPPPSVSKAPPIDPAAKTVKKKPASNSAIDID